MTEYQFGEQNNNSYQPIQDPNTRGMAGLLIKWGMAKDVKTAETILLVFALVLIAISIYLFATNL
jgi:hypothetical protein